MNAGELSTAPLKDTVIKRLLRAPVKDAVLKRLLRAPAAASLETRSDVSPVLPSTGASVALAPVRVSYDRPQATRRPGSPHRLCCPRRLSAGTAAQAPRIPDESVRGGGAPDGDAWADAGRRYPPTHYYYPPVVGGVPFRGTLARMLTFSVYSLPYHGRWGSFRGLWRLWWAWGRTG